MAKVAKIDDIKRPDKVLPSATSRPILVSGPPAMPANDPMLASPDDAASKADVPEEPSVLSHTAKTIKPPDAAAAGPAPDSADDPAKLAPEPDAPVSKPAPAAGSPGPDTAEPAAKADEDVVRDPEAAQTAAETAANEAKAKRETELESIIASGKYTVPINAVQRKRSRMAALLLCLLALVLTVILLDVVFDVGLVEAPDGVPHTHFFSK